MRLARRQERQKRVAERHSDRALCQSTIRSRLRDDQLAEERANAEVRGSQLCARDRGRGQLFGVSILAFATAIECLAKGVDSAIIKNIRTLNDTYPWPV